MFKLSTRLTVAISVSLFILNACSNESNENNQNNKNLFTVSGTIEGLSRPVQLTMGNETIAIGSDGPFAFSTKLADGTSYDVIAVKNMHQICDSASGKITGSDASDLAISCRGVAYYNGDDGVNGTELWRTDGTPTGTYMVKDINPIGDIAIDEMLITENELYLLVTDGISPRKLWKSDGSETGTVLVKDFGDNAFPNGLTEMNGKIYFAGYDSINGEELWITDGTPAGTKLVKDIFPGSTGSSPRELTVSNNTLFFAALDATSAGIELWKSDGTAAGTVLLKDAASTEKPSSPRNLMNFNNKLYFTRVVGGVSELWKSDGTSVGTEFVASVDAVNLTAWGNSLYFHNSANNGSQLWKTDGTSAGTVMVKDTYPGGAISMYPNNLVVMNNTLYFTSDDSVNGAELWKSDGTTDGTVMVTDISGSIASDPNYLTNINGKLYFAAQNANNTQELWKSDGSASGTVLVADTNMSSYANNIAPLNVGIGGKHFFHGGGQFFYFIGTDGLTGDGYHGYEVWTSYGTASGTKMLLDANPTGDGVYDRGGDYIEPKPV